MLAPRPIVRGIDGTIHQTYQFDHAWADEPRRGFLYWLLATGRRSEYPDEALDPDFARAWKLRPEDPR